MHRQRPPQFPIQTKIKCSKLRYSLCGRPDNLSVCGRVKCQLLSCHQKKIMRINVFPPSCLVSFLSGGRTYTSSGALFAHAAAWSVGCGACAAGWPKMMTFTNVCLWMLKGFPKQYHIWLLRRLWFYCLTNTVALWEFFLGLLVSVSNALLIDQTIIICINGVW